MRISRCTIPTLTSLLQQSSERTERVTKDKGDCKDARGKGGTEKRLETDRERKTVRTVGREVLETFQQSSQLQMRRITDADERFLQGAGDAVLRQDLQRGSCRKKARSNLYRTIVQAEVRYSETRWVAYGFSRES